MRYILVFIFLSTILGAQTPEKIKIKKDDSFYFFQVGQKSDTISAGKNDLFYLKLTGVTGCTTRIEIENGRLFKTANDTIYQLKNVPNLQYEHYFQDTTWVANKPFKGNNKCHKFISHINGANENSASHTIKIIFYNLYSKEAILSNTFYYK